MARLELLCSLLVCYIAGFKILFLIFSDFARKVKWLHPGSPGHVALVKVLEQPYTIRTLKLLNHGMHTGKLENLHSLLISYAPKRIDFDPPSYQARVKLAIVDHNRNAARKVSKDGKFSIDHHVTLIIVLLEALFCMRKQIKK